MTIKHILNFKAILFLLLFNGCSGCCGHVSPHYTYTDIEIHRVGNGNSEDLFIVTAEEPFYLDFQYSFEYVSEFKWNDLFVNKSYAFSCSDDGSAGLKSPITSIEITADSEFLDIAAGENLIQMFTPVKLNLDPDPADDMLVEAVSYSEYYDYINNFQNQQIVYLRLDTYPEQGTNYAFQLQFNSGSSDITSPFSESFSFQ